MEEKKSSNKKGKNKQRRMKVTVSKQDKKEKRKYKHQENLPKTNFSTHDGAIVPFFCVVLNDSALISLPPRSTNVKDRNGSDVPLRAHGIKFLASTISTVNNLFFGVATRPDGAKGDPFAFSCEAFLPNISNDFNFFQLCNLNRQYN
jgi:hypothetical protein